MTLEAAHDVATAIEAQVRQVAPNANVLVHIDPVAARHESLVDAMHALSAWPTWVCRILIVRTVLFCN